MQVHVTRVPRPNTTQPVEVREGATVAEVLRRIQVPVDAVVVIRGETPIPADAPVSEGDRLRVVNVFSGG